MSFSPFVAAPRSRNGSSLPHITELEEGQESAAKDPLHEALLEEIRLCLWDSIEKKESFAGVNVVLKDGHVLQPYADIYFKETTSRSDSGGAVLSIGIDQVDLQVKSLCAAGCCCKGRAWTPLLFKDFSIKLVPQFVNRCYRVRMEPVLDSETFGLQKTSSVTLHVGYPRGIAVSYNNSKSISRGAPAFGWEPAQREDGNDNVTFSWGQHRYKEGGKIETDTLKFGPIPQLAIQSKFIHMPPASFVAKASWEWECNSQEELEKVFVDMEVTFYPLLQTKYSILGYKNIVLPPQRISDRRILNRSACDQSNIERFVRLVVYD